MPTAFSLEKRLKHQRTVGTYLKAIETEQQCDAYTVAHTADLYVIDTDSIARRWYLCKDMSGNKANPLPNK